MNQEANIVSPDDRILVTGAAGFIGPRAVQSLVDHGLRNIVCFVRPSSNTARIEGIVERRPPGTLIEIFKGNLLSRGLRGRMQGCGSDPPFGSRHR